MSTDFDERALPLHVPILAGESFDSWLEALARRLELTISELLPVLGLAARARSGRYSLLWSIDPRALRRIERQTRLPPGRLDQATLERFRTWAPLLRGAGSRYCPHCLRESDGRWPAAWRLAWTFACTRHDVLLADVCDGCRRRPRRSVGTAGRLNVAATCSNPFTSARVCGWDLRAASVPALTRDDPILTAQRELESVLGTGSDAPHDGRMADGPGLLTDLRLTASWYLRQITSGDFASSHDHIESQWLFARERATRGQVVDSAIPIESALTGFVAGRVLPWLTGRDSDAIAQIRALVRRNPQHGILATGLQQVTWSKFTPGTRTLFLHAIEPEMGYIDRIRYRARTPQPRLPEDGQAESRARNVPQALWPGWTMRMLPAKGFRGEMFRSAMSACLLMPGNPARSNTAISAHLHSHLRHHLTPVLQRLARQGHQDVFIAICRIADHLDQHGSPIDYQRRREAITGEVITEEEWRDLSYQASAHPGEHRRLLDACRYLYLTLTGADLNDPSHPHAFRTAADRSFYLQFAASLTSPLRDALHRHASEQLARLGIDEPLTWEPPAECATGLRLPGPGPEAVDLATVRRLVLDHGTTLRAAAQNLGIGIDHVRLALEHIPRGARAWGQNAAPNAYWRVEQARSVLTREYFEHEYLTGRKRLRQIAAEVDLDRRLVSRIAKDLGIEMLPAWKLPMAIDETWLREQYVERKRSSLDIAAELGVDDMTVTRHARAHGIPIRSAGIASRPVMIQQLDDSVAVDIRHAVEGTLHGWLRLHRFQVAMTFPSIGAAAKRLDSTQSALTTQFHRLERDIGAQLYVRAGQKRPMRATPRGQALLEALAHPQVQKLMQQASANWARPMPAGGMQRWSPERHQASLKPKPSDLTPQKARSRVAAPRPPRITAPKPKPPRVREVPTACELRVTSAVLAVLRVLLDAHEELYGMQISNRSGLSDGTLSPLLKRLQDAGWIISRRETPEAWQQNPTGLAGVNRARRTYHALTEHGQLAALREVSSRTSPT
jgi:TniQ/Bacterial regulatory helix-turn-helix protein, lysR family